jgi:hypothetical protein
MLAELVACGGIDPLEMLGAWDEPGDEVGLDFPLTDVESVCGNA